ncbi:hypothetical protein BC939DRAFT_466262 [Gamsiella multidivaricata]|uniref:uncharacterized protein n=1 Tax=Gamsiella multidivaricata TaxID=101098 RepID=UPI0022205404|nr:uncharacterized protein BC939DRAFT_466262 [Gamsiella multidivaricata]KAI7817378.1 hypothetical protein BC939DRAFT_466262 [Gamsiella multidivaricata]
MAASTTFGVLLMACSLMGGVHSTELAVKQLACSIVGTSECLFRLGLLVRWGESIRSPAALVSRSTRRDTGRSAVSVSIICACGPTKPLRTLVKSLIEAKSTEAPFLTWRRVTMLLRVSRDTV